MIWLPGAWEDRLREQQRNRNTSSGRSLDNPPPQQTPLYERGSPLSLKVLASSTSG